MALGSTDISVSAVKTETGLSTTNDILGLNTSSSLNAYAFYNPRPLVFNGSTLILEPSTDPSPYKFGDFRLYDHSAVAPSFNGTAASYAFDPGASTITIGCIYDNREANILRANSSATYIRVRFFTTLTGGVLSNQVGSSQVFNLTKVSKTVLSDHSVTQTESYPSGSSGLMLPTFPTSGITTSAVTRYGEMFFTNSTGSIEYGKLSTNYFSFTVRQKADPTGAVQSTTPFPSGWSQVYAITTDFTGNTIGSSSITFKFKVWGIQSGTGTSNYVTGTLSLSYFNTSTSSYVNLSSYQNVSYAKATASTWSLTVTYTLPDRTWNYDETYTFRALYNTASF